MPVLKLKKTSFWENGKKEQKYAKKNEQKRKANKIINLIQLQLKFF
jgi:hypothetical protein